MAEVKERVTKEIKVAGEYGITVRRIRKGDGFCGIRITLATKAGTQKVDITNQKPQQGGYGDDYELVAFELARVLDEAASNPCSVAQSAEV